MSDGWVAVGRQGKPAHAPTPDADGEAEASTVEALYVRLLVRALRKRDGSQAMQLSLLTDPNRPFGCPFPDVLRERYLNLSSLLECHADVFKLHNDPAQPKQWFVSLLEDSSGDDEELRQLTYLKEVAAMLHTKTWSAGGSVGSDCPLPRSRKAEGITLKQLVVKFPNFVEMKYKEDSNLYYRRGKRPLLTGSLPARARVLETVARPNPSLRPPEESRQGDWACEKCQKPNFWCVDTCANLKCGVARVLDAPKSVTSASPSLILPPPYTPREDPSAVQDTPNLDSTYRLAGDAFVRRVAAGLDEGWNECGSMCHMFPTPPLLKVLFRKSGQLLLRHPQLFKHQYRYAKKGEHPPVLWFRKAIAHSTQLPPQPFLPPPLIVAPTLQLQALAVEQWQLLAEEKASLPEHRRQEVVEKKSTLSEVFHELRLEKYTPLFEEQEIDHETLTQMEEHHFADIDLPAGPRLRLMDYIKDWRAIHS